VVPDSHLTTAVQPDVFAGFTFVSEGVMSKTS
jgi:hypothetical protein